MALPVCPPGFECTFTPKEPKHYFEHWWDSAWGFAAIVVALIAVCIIAAIFFDYIKYRRQQNMDLQNKREGRAHREAMMEQLTMQLDASDGDPEILNLIREQQKKLTQ